ncbi:hypothetical protein BJ508DRAFT_29997 [Ascobolus immersus RN42]|uniref:Uncharacterized protein n=1 Tax=Ascobolus immersus RN42 TaxID=1160509 RepID=A0A3N4HYP8_ASCIM|nr:hypothetical protein BJ508DRAFT_29997 [Ascobolus immersus RN42]
MELGFTVNKGPLSQISLPIMDLAAAAHLAYGAYEWWKARREAQSLDAIVDNSGAVIVAPASFNTRAYIALRKADGGLSGFAKLANGRFGSVNMPNASTACDGDSGIQCLRAITTATLCLFDPETTLRIFRKALPGTLIQSQLDDDNFDFNGPIISSLRRFINAVHTEEEVDPIRRQLLEGALQSARSLLRDTTVAADQITGSKDDIGGSIGLLSWVLSETGKRRTCYPTASLSVWVLSDLLSRLGLDCQPSYPELDSLSLYMRYINDSSGGYPFSTYLATAPGTATDLAKVPVDPSRPGKARSSTLQPIRITLRHFPYLIARYNDPNKDRNYRNEGCSGLAVRAYRALFFGIFESAWRFVDGIVSNEHQTLLDIVRCLGKLSTDLSSNPTSSQDLRDAVQNWIEEMWKEDPLADAFLMLKGNDFELRRKSKVFSDCMGSGDEGSTPFNLVVATISRALAYAMLVKALGHTASSVAEPVSDAALDIEVTIILDSSSGLPFLDLDHHTSTILQYFELVNAIPEEFRANLRWQDRAAPSSEIPRVRPDFGANTFYLYAHLLSGSPALMDMYQPSGTVIGVYFSGKTVLKKHYVDRNRDPNNTHQLSFLVADGLPLGLPVEKDGCIVYCSRNQVTSAEVKLEHRQLPDSKRRSFKSLASTVFEMGTDNAPDTASLRLDLEIDWEEDDSRVSLVTRQHGQTVARRAVDLSVVESKEFEQLWTLRMETPERCGCPIPTIRGTRTFSYVYQMSASALLGSKVEDLGKELLKAMSKALSLSEKASGAGPEGGVLRQVIYAATKGSTAAQYRALESFLVSVHGKLSIEWPEMSGRLGPKLVSLSRADMFLLMEWQHLRLREGFWISPEGRTGSSCYRKGTIYKIAITKIYFASCMHCWERDVVDKEEAWYNQMIASGEIDDRFTVMFVSLVIGI